MVYSAAWSRISRTRQFSILANLRDLSAKKFFGTGRASCPTRPRRHWTGFLQIRYCYTNHANTIRLKTKRFCPSAGMAFLRRKSLDARRQQPPSVTSSVGVRPSLSDCRSSSAAQWTVDSSFTLNHLFPASEAPSSTALLHNSFNKAHYLTVLKQSNLTSKDFKKRNEKKSSLPTHIKVSSCKREPISEAREISCSRLLLILGGKKDTALKTTNYVLGVR